MPYIIYAAAPHGYAVQVVDAGRVIEEYSAGNHALCSQSYATPGGRNALPLATLERFAEQSAREMAAERGIDSVEYDDDLEDSLAENFPLEYA